MTQEQAAEIAGVSPTTWGRWERGGQKLRPSSRALIATTFNIDADTLDHWLNNTPPADTALYPITDFGDESAPVTVEAFERLWRCDMDASRRHLLAALPFVPATLSEWLSSTYDTPNSPVAHDGPAPAVGHADVTRINQARQAFTQMDHQFGAGLVRPAIVDFLNTTVAPMLRGSYDGRVGAALMTAAAGITRLAGWTAYDLGNQGQAQHYLGQALKLARTGNDPTTTSWVLTAMTQQAIQQQHPIWAVRLAHAAVDSARRAQASPRVMALMLVREAWATALQTQPAEVQHRHNAKQVQRLITEAEHEYAKGTADRDPQWIASYELAELNAEIGRSWDLLGEHTRALVCAQEAVGAFAERHPRSAQLNQIHAADAHLQNKELEQALHCARTAIPVAKTLTSMRLLGHIRGFAKRLEPYATTIQVREFRAYMAGQLAA